jgi:hypothetical protein
MSKDFKLWLEFVEVDPDNWDIHNDFCNIQVNLPDGRHYGINVWTFANLNGLYLKPPDLFVRELTRDCIEKTISNLLEVDDLEKMLNPTIYSKVDQPNKLPTT